MDAAVWDADDDPLWELFAILGELAEEPGSAATVIYRHETRAEGLHEDLRTISKLHVFTRNGTHLVTAYDDLSHSRRTFRLDRIELLSIWHDVGIEATVGDVRKGLRVVRGGH